MEQINFLNIGNEYLAGKLFKKAIAAFTDAIKTNPSVSAYAGRAEAYYGYAWEAAGTTPSDIGMYKKFERELSHRKEFALALKDLNRIIGLEPDYPNAYLNIGIIHYDTGDYQKAVSTFRKVLEIHSKNYDTYYFLALAYIKTGRDDLAMQNLNILIKLNPEYADAFRERSIFYSLNGNYQDGIADINHALALQPANPDLYFHRGLAIGTPAMDSGNIDNLLLALKDFTKAIELNPKYPEAYLHRSFIYASLDEYEKEFDDLSMAIKLDPACAEAYRLRTGYYTRTGNKKLAMLDWIKFCSLMPGSAYDDAIANAKEKLSFNSLSR